MKHMLLAILVLAASACPAFSQQKQPGRIAVVHVGRVLDQYEKAARLKKQNRITVTKDVEREFAKIQESHLPGLWKDLQDAIKIYATEHKIETVLGYGEPLDPDALDQFPNITRKMQAMDGGSTVPLRIAAPADITQPLIDLLNKRPPDKAAKELPVGTNRIAIVDIGYIFNGFRKTSVFKKEREQDFQPFKQEENLLLLWKEVQDAIKFYARRHDIDLVLGYGEVPDAKLLNRFPNVNRKVHAMNAGGIVPLVVPAKQDISAAVVKLLNSPSKERPFQIDDLPEPTPAMRVVHVNISYILDKYVQADRFKKELEDTVAPLKRKQARLTKETKEWQSAFENRAFAGGTEEELRSKIKQNKRDLEDLTVEIDRLVGRKQEETLVILWAEIQLGNEKVSSAYGFQLVLGYGDPLDKNVQDAFPNVNRKMHAIEGGAAVMLYPGPSLDLSHAVTETLNRWAPPAK